MTTVAIYCRISQDRTGAGLGVERQEADCRAMAEREGWHVGPVLVDNDVSAHTGKRYAKKRPGYTRLLGLVRSGAVDRVIVWHTDRLLRSSRELEEYIAASQMHGVATHGVTAGNIDLSTATGRMNARIGAAIAQGEIEHRAERMQSKQEQSVRAGRWIGGTRPFGWRIDNLVPTIDEAEAALIRDATARVLAGGTLGGIIREWNEAGITTSVGKSWSYATLRQMLTRSRNAGIVTYNELEGSWPAIVDEGSWRALCALLEDPSRRRSTSNRAKWLMAGIARCACGAPVRSAWVGTRKGEKVLVYRCRQRGEGHVGRRARDVDGLIERVVLGYLEKPATLKALRAGHEPAGSNATLAAEAQALRARLDEAAAMFAAGDLTAAQLRRVNTDIRPRLEAMEARMSASRGSGALAPFLTGQESVRDVWARIDIDSRRAIIAELLTVTIKRTDPQARRVFDPTTIEFDWKLAA